MRAVILLLCAALTLPAARAESPQEPEPFNPFADSYVSKRQPAAGGQAEPRIYVGRDRLADHQSMLEEGYDLLGYSSFQAGSVPPEQLAAHARQVRADVVIIYTSGKGRVRDADSLPEGADPTLYDYFAAYWTRLPPPLLGLHVQKNRQTDAGGLTVVAVIRRSPAAQAGLQRGDILLQLGGVTLEEPMQMVETAARLAGQQTEVVFLHDGERVQRPLTLAPAP